VHAWCESGRFGPGAAKSVVDQGGRTCSSGHDRAKITAVHRLVGTISGAIAIGALLVLTACASRQTWIMVGNAPQDMQLLIGDQAWPVTKGAGTGVVAIDTFGTLNVRIVTPDCEQVLAFEASSGSAHVIGFPVEGPPLVEDITGQPMPMGPGLEATEAAC
jgi:hypothetical protein